MKKFLTVLLMLSLLVLLLSACDDEQMDVIQSIMQEAKPNQAEQFRMSRERLSKYFSPEASMQKIEETILRALEALRQRERTRSGEAR